MVYAVGLAAAVFALWLALAQDISQAALTSAGAAAAVVTVYAWRLRLLDREGAPYHRAPGILWLALRRLPDGLRGAWRVSLGAVGAVERLRPGFLRLRVPAASGLARAVHTAAASAAPGVVVAHADDTSVLLHVWSEPAALPAPLLALEREAVVAADGRSAAR